MEKKISDFLHLYLGCKVRHPGLGNDLPLNGRWMESLVEKNILVKLILRPIKDLTIDELAELCKLCTEQNRWNDITIHDLEIKNKRIHYSDGSRLQGDGYDELQDLYVDFDHLNPEQFRYILKIGIDLFGLIGAGIAIDKTTLAAVG